MNNVCATQAKKYPLVAALQGPAGCKYQELSMAEKSVVIKRQDEIEIFMNEDDGITIKQKCWPEGDQVIFFNHEHAEIVAQAILEVYSEIKRGK